MGRRQFKESDFVDKEFGFLTILKFTKIKRTKTGAQFVRYCLCKCRCGKTREFSLTNIRSGQSKSCGCKPNKRNTKHRLSRHPLYSVWTGAMERCYNNEGKNYSNYGGRGIVVYSKWHNAEVFIKEVSEILGEKPNGDYSIDRVDNDKGYFPNNIRWATQKQQMNNKRISGKLTAKKIADLTGYSKERIRQLTRPTTSNKYQKTFPLGDFIVGKIGASNIYSPEAVGFLIKRRKGFDIIYT